MPEMEINWLNDNNDDNSEQLQYSHTAIATSTK